MQILSRHEKKEILDLEDKISLSLKQALFQDAQLCDSGDFPWASTVLGWILLLATESVVYLPLREVERKLQE